jgi:2-amino-4-hydroxy-6-hydroxymethyldihydropteridine diphosphokinase
MIFLGLGSNLPSKYGDRFTNINLAISSLEGYGIKVIKKSSFYETPSYPNKENPKFINAVILVETILPPIDLMSVLIFIEEKLERKRGKKNDPRTCDIDIIDYNSQILNLRYNNLDLTVPHKELTLRNFILFPLQEISPTWEHPKTKEIISVLLQKLNDEDKNSILKIVKN